MMLASRTKFFGYVLVALAATACDSENEPRHGSASVLSQLKSLAVSSGELSPQFTWKVLEYNVTVDRENYSITVTAIPLFSKTKVEMFLNDVEVDSSFRLKVGMNRLVIRVASTVDPDAMSEYIVNIDREALRNTTLDTLIVQQQPVIEIQKTGSGYEFVYDYSVDNANIQVVLEDSLATAVVASKVSGSVYSDPVHLSTGINHLEIVVTADDGETTRSYDLTITRNPWILVDEEAPFSRRDGALVVEFKGKLWLFGGYPFDPPNNINIWVSSDGENWSLAGTPPTELLRHAVTPIVHQDKIWVISGDGKNDVWNSANGVNWSQIATNLPWGYRYSPYLFSFQGKLWLMGGFSWWDENGNFVIPDGGPTIGYNDVWSSEDGVIWNKVLEHAPWTPRAMTHGSVIFNDRIWIIGGGIKDADTIEAFNEVWSSEDGIHWDQMPDAPWEPRYHFSAAVFDGRIWITDGSVYPRQSNLSNEVWFTEDGKSWTELKGTPWPNRHASGLIEFQNNLLLLCGMNLDGVTLNDIWKLESGNSY